MTDFIDSLELSVRASNVLRNMLDPIDSAEKFLALERERVLLQPNCGRRTWAEIKQMQDYLRGENINTKTTPQPKHPTALPDVVAQRLADLARAHGYGIEKLRLVWTTTLGGCPDTATVEYDVTARVEEDKA
jgi:hypothetical protein